MYPPTQRDVPPVVGNVIGERSCHVGAKTTRRKDPTIALRISGYCSQGGRFHMEDEVAIEYPKSSSNSDAAIHLYVGVFDGHGGTEAAQYAKKHLYSQIVQDPLWASNDDAQVLKAIKRGFMTLQTRMQPERDNWKKTKNGYESTAGTCATIIFIREGKLFIGHVGDSRVAAGYQSPGSSPNSPWKANQLTVDHKPENPKERARIEAAGGAVRNTRGVHRVVWRRRKHFTSTCLGEMDGGKMVEIPFLAVARSLGDFWSYNAESKTFIVSPKPDVRVVKLDENTFRCVILASDGVWGIMSTKASVRCVQQAEMTRMKRLGREGSEQNASESLVKEALKKWKANKSTADNISVVTIIIDCPTKVGASRDFPTGENAHLVVNLPVDACPVGDSAENLDFHVHGVPKSEHKLKELTGVLSRPPNMMSAKHSASKSPTHIITSSNKVVPMCNRMVQTASSGIINVPSTRVRVDVHRAHVTEDQIKMMKFFQTEENTANFLKSMQLPEQPPEVKATLNQELSTRKRRRSNPTTSSSESLRRVTRSMKKI